MQPQIVLRVDGGIVTLVSSNVDADIIVRDYDMECYDEDELVSDEDGNEYKEFHLL